MGSAGESFYFGLLGTNAIDGRETIRFFDPSQEQFLEYEVSRLIHTLATTDRQKIGVLTSLPLEGTPPNPMTQGRGDPPWQIVTELRALFDVQMLDPTATEIPPDVNVLLLVHPQNLSDELVYSIDQFVLGGGNVAVFIDPHCESQLPPPMARQDPMAAFQMDRTSSLPRLLDAWGVTFDTSKIAGDFANAQRVAVPVQGRREAVSYIGWIGLGNEFMNQDDAVTGRLASVILATSGILEPEDDATTTMEPLLRTSSESQRVDSMRFRFGPDPRGLLTDFLSGDEELVLAARVSGTASSAFPDGAPGGVGGEHLASGEINVLLTADADMLADRFWVQQVTLGQLSLGARKLADNGNYLVNALDNLSGSSDLISVRARGEYARPFELVEDIQRRSEQEYRAEEQRLQDELAETERKLTELQAARPDQGELILTPEQQAELERFNQQRVETRKQLRAVRLNLRKDIEQLGARLKIINIGGAPLLVALAAIALGIYRTIRRRVDRRAVAQT
jgi:ABC-type uncharacterized transport system involved in gliding motility auxiliary subunit